MAGAIYELAKSPEVQSRLRQDPTLVDTAVEETVRLHAPVVMVARTVTSDTDIAGVSLRAGDRIGLNFAAASRDPDVCENPQSFDLDRAEVVHTAFGVGPHWCIGEHLARLEIRVTIEEMLMRIPDFRIQPGTTPKFESGQLRTMHELHLSWGS
jgi:cytochrome P450